MAERDSSGKFLKGHLRPHRKSSEELFWAKVEKTEGCWLWHGATIKRGYGTFHWGGRTKVASRVVLEMALGRELLRHEYACHHCDNPSCVRPDHLFLGNHASNMDDAWTKGRLFPPRSTHCPHGHEWTPENTKYIRGKRTRSRICIECARRRGREYYHRHARKAVQS